MDNEYYEKQHRILNKKKVLLYFTETFLGLGSAITTSTMSLLKTSFGIVLIFSTAPSTSFAILITNEYISKLKLRYSKLRVFINVITLLYEKTLQQ